MKPLEDDVMWRMDVLREEEGALAEADEVGVVFRYKGDGSSELVRGEVVAVVRVWLRCGGQAIDFLHHRDESVRVWFEELTEDQCEGVA